VRVKSFAAACVFLAHAALLLGPGPTVATARAQPVVHGTRESRLDVAGMTVVLHLGRVSPGIEAEIREDLEGGFARIARELGVPSRRTYHYVVEPDLDRLRAAAAGALPEWGIGFAFPRRRTVVLGLRESGRLPGRFREVLLHETSHVLFHDAVAGVRCPRWFVEGLAMTQAGTWGAGDSWSVTVASLTGNLPSLPSLAGRFPAEGSRADLAYRLSFLAVQEIFKDHYEGSLADFCARVRRTGDFARAFEEHFGRSPIAFAQELDKTVRRRYGWVSLFTRLPGLFMALTFLFLVAYATRMIRNRRRMREWERLEGRGGW
jgi:hypothetical protein